MQYFEFQKEKEKENIFQDKKFGVKIWSEKLQDRPAGIPFFLYYCRIDPNQEDAHIKRDPFFFQ